jgi:hypothetical protein
MTINIGSAEPVPISGGTRQEAREARRRQHVVTLVMLAAAARKAVDRRTLAGAIVLAIALVAVKGLAQERGMPGLDWYRGLGETGAAAGRSVARRSTRRKPRPVRPDER